MTSHEERKQVITLLKDTIKAGARQAKACDILGLSERTLQRWQTDQTVLLSGTGFATPFLTFKISKVIEASKRFGRGCKPRPA